MLRVCSRQWTSDLLEACSLHELKARRTHLSLFYKLVNEFPNFPVNVRQLNYPTRSGRSNLFGQPYPHSNSFLYSFFPHTVSLSPSVATAPPIISFNRQL